MYELKEGDWSNCAVHLKELWMYEVFCSVFKTTADREIWKWADGQLGGKLYGNNYCGEVLDYFIDSGHDIVEFEDCFRKL